MQNVATINRDNESLFSAECEQSVLGAILLNNEILEKIGPRLKPDHFYDPVHQRIFTTIVELTQVGSVATPVTLKTRLANDEGLKELGGPPYLVRLAAASMSTHLADHYVDYLVELSDKRHIISVIDAAQWALIEGKDDAGEIAAKLENELATRHVSSGPKPVSMMRAVTTALEQSFAAYSGEAGLCLPSGIHGLDRMITGFYPGDMVILGGRPSMGKTSVALNIALNVARAGAEVGIVSLEMTPEALANRALSEASAHIGNPIAYQDIRAGSYSPQDGENLKAAAREAANLPIQFLARDYRDVASLLSGARDIRRRMGGLKLLIVDYTQLLRADGRSRYEEITNISIELKSLAQMLDIPVIALSQLSRQVEQRDDKRPILSDLRESGQLEQDADSVIFCYRDEYYLEREQPDSHDLEATALWQDAMDRAHNRLELIVAKQRQGPIGTAKVFANVALNRIWEPGI